MNNSKSEYISLQEATQYCQYSQEYLSLRARQGRLKAIKFGRNWVTTKEWLSDYIHKTEDWNQKIKNRNKERKIEEFIASFKALSQRTWSRIPSRVLIVTAIFLFLITGIVFGKEVLINTWNKISAHLEETTLGAWQAVESRVLDPAWQMVRSIFLREFLEPEPEPEIVIKEQPQPGLVVIPSFDKDEEVKQKIKEIFSDEVRVEPIDETSGIIVPIFREGEGERFLYIMVPLNF